MTKINWGIIGLGSTTSRFLKGLSLLNDGNFYAIASRTAEKIEKIKQTFPQVIIYTSYDDLLNDENVHAIYITLRHNDHYVWAKKALEKGKAVLCEKPATLYLRETEDIINTAQKNQVMFIEALKTRFMPLNQKLHELLNEEIIGEIKQIETAFGYTIPDEHARYLYDTQNGGILNDVGTYTLGAILDFIKSPVQFIEVECDKKKDVDAYEKITLHFENGVIGIAQNALDRNLDRNMTIVGTLGSIFVKDYHRAS